MRRFASGVLLEALLLANVALASAPLRHGSPTRLGMHGSVRLSTRPAKAAATAHRSWPLPALRQATKSIQGASSLPPTAPTTWKGAPQSAPQKALDKTGSPIIGGPKPDSSQTAAQIRAQAAPPDAAPLRPAVASAKAPAPAPVVTTRGSKALITSPKPPQPEAVPIKAITPAVPAVAAAAPTPATGGTTPPRTHAAVLAPGPLSNLPITVTASPNDVKISGLGSSSAPWGIVLLLTTLTVLPSILICITPFARLLVVFHFLRQALGLQTTPSNQTLIGLTLILTFFIMEPVGRQVYQDSILPLQSGQITAFEAMARGEGPMRDFMAHFVREKDAALFLEIAREPRPRDIHDLSMRVLVPAYIVSELKAGFQIGAVLFLPFLVVDMVVASITTSVGMMQLPPVVISTPLKLLLFLMVDGWHLLIGALVRSFQ